MAFAGLVDDDDAIFHSVPQVWSDRVVSLSGGRRGTGISQPMFFTAFTIASSEPVPFSNRLLPPQKRNYFHSLDD